jgi:hypothetical protein
MGQGYEQAQTTWGAWVKVMPVGDFKQFSMPKLSAFSDMDVIPDGHPFKYGSLSDKREGGQATVKGKALNIPWQVFVNDDLNSMTRVPGLMGSSYNWRQNKDVYDELWGPAGVGVTMNEDSVACFNSAHGNYDTGAGAPSTTTLGAARTKMRNQTAPKAEKSDADRPLNLVPAWIIHGTSLETTTEQLLSNIGRDISKSNDITIQPFAQGGRTPLQIIVDAYLETLTTTGWYLACSQNQLESIVMLALDGVASPSVRSEDSRVGEALGMNFDVYGAYDVMTADYRSLYYHAGA